MGIGEITTWEELYQYWDSIVKDNFEELQEFVPEIVRVSEVAGGSTSDGTGGDVSVGEGASENAEHYVNYAFWKPVNMADKIIKGIREDNKHMIKSMRSGTATTCNMLLKAKDPEEFAAIWIVGVCNSVLNYKTGSIRGIGYSKVLHMEDLARDFLVKRGLGDWRYSATHFVPHTFFHACSFGVAEVYELMHWVVANAFAIKNKYKVVVVTSLKDEDLKESISNYEKLEGNYHIKFTE